MKSTPDENDESFADDELAFHFIKSRFFRVIHVDGAWGGITPDANIHLTLFNERPAIPKTVFYTLSSTGHLEDEIKERRVTRGGVVREVEADLVVDLATARSLQAWIGGLIEQAELLLGDAEEE